MKRREYQSGFGAIETLFVIVAVGIIGTAGWFVYQHNRTKATNAAASADQSSNQPSTAQQQAVTQPAPTIGYLTIKEWGVKLPLSDAVKDAYYVPNSSSPDINNPDSILIGIKSLDTSGCAAADTNNGKPGALALIGRVVPTATDPVSGMPYTQLYPNGATVGTYYYFFQDRTKQLKCAPQATLQGISTAITNSIKNTTIN